MREIRMPYLTDAVVGCQPEKDAEQLQQLNGGEILISFKNTWIQVLWSRYDNWWEYSNIMPATIMQNFNCGDPLLVRTSKWCLIGSAMITCSPWALMLPSTIPSGAIGIPRLGEINYLSQFCFNNQRSASQRVVVDREWCLCWEFCVEVGRNMSIVKVPTSLGCRLHRTNLDVLSCYSSRLDSKIQVRGTFHIVSNPNSRPYFRTIPQWSYHAYCSWSPRERKFIHLILT